MSDPFNPTHDEIKSWAYVDSSLEPVQDWDLMITQDKNSRLLLELASDQNCPKKSYFLRCLYLYVGDYVRAKGTNPDIQNAKKLVEDAGNLTDPEIQRWVKRSKELLNHPETFNYNDWCESGLVTQDNKTLS